jgi:hypothetical protein
MARDRPACDTPLPFLVIPVQAGIDGARRDQRLVILRRPWTPAFAGATILIEFISSKSSQEAARVPKGARTFAQPVERP